MNITEVLGEGRRTFLAGLATALPWILAAELLPLTPPFNDAGGFSSSDIPQIILCGLLQAFLYGMAILRLPLLVSDVSGKRWHHALRAVPWLFVAYIIYELLIGIGLVVALVFFVVGYLSLGLVAALVVCLVPLVPTAVASTAFALFAFPAVLEGRGPFASLDDSRRLVMRHWARASVVISVPAIGLLVLWLIPNAEYLFKTLPEMMLRISGISPDSSPTQVESLLSSMETPAAPGFPLQLVLAAAASLVWWYTLAVCYAEYRELAGRKSA